MIIVIIRGRIADTLSDFVSHVVSKGDVTELIQNVCTISIYSP